jgi:hypothetical protein
MGATRGFSCPYFALERSAEGKNYTLGTEAIVVRIRDTI